MFSWQGGKFPNDYFLHISRCYLQYTWPKLILFPVPHTAFNQHFQLPAHSDHFSQTHHQKHIKHLHVKCCYKYDLGISRKHTTNNVANTLILGADTNTIWVLKYSKTNRNRGSITPPQMYSVPPLLYRMEERLINSHPDDALKGNLFFSLISTGASLEMNKIINYGLNIDKIIWQLLCGRL